MALLNKRTNQGQLHLEVQKNEIYRVGLSAYYFKGKVPINLLKFIKDRISKNYYLC
jgi:hypothetical protein